MRWLLWIFVLLISSTSFAEDIVKTYELADPTEAESLVIAPNDQAANVAPPVVLEPDLKESEIPVLAAVKNKKIEEKSSTMRVFFSVIVIALLAGGLLLFSKWYSKNNKVSAETTKIKVLTQHFLGPRKSLAIIRVAGETMLIGVTDQNISMIKSLSLIDDEFPEVMPNNFEKTLKTANEKINVQSPEDEVDDFVISSVKDKISAKIKNMRNI